MFDTNLVVVGNVLAAPEWRRIASSGSLVANFRVASTARRFDRESNTWVDGNNFRVRVTAWRRLAEGVISSIAVGDPVIVFGRLYTRDWRDENGNHRVSYEMDATSIGHDLAKGRARFTRNKAGQGLGVVEDAEAEAFVAGEPSVPLTADEAPIGYGDGVPDQEAPTFLEVMAGRDESGPVERPEEAEPADAHADQDGTAAGRATAGDAQRRTAVEEARSRAVAAAGGDERAAADGLSLDVERLAATPPGGARRARRGPRREPVAA